MLRNGKNTTSPVYWAHAGALTRIGGIVGSNGTTSGTIPDGAKPMHPTARHILELMLVLVACRLGGVDLHGDSGYRKASQTVTCAVDANPQT